MKTEVERVWTEWEERLREAEEERAKVEISMEEKDVKIKGFKEEVGEKKREIKELKELVEKARMELKVVQDKYEEELRIKEFDLQEI